MSQLLLVYYIYITRSSNRLTELVDFSELGIRTNFPNRVIIRINYINDKNRRRGEVGDGL